MNPTVLEELTVLKKETVGSCDHCGRTGYKINFETSTDVPCQCLRVLKYCKELIKARIPRDYWQLSLPELAIDSKYKAYVNKFLTHFQTALDRGLGFMLAGANGIGKTALMAEIAKFAICEGHEVSYFTLQTYISSTYPDSEIHCNHSPKILLIDELDKVYIRHGSEYVMKATDEFMRASLAKNKVLICATNSTQNGLSEMFGQSTMSQLNRRLFYIPMKGQDYTPSKQESWLTDLTESYDYYHDNIMHYVNRMKERKTA